MKNKKVLKSEKKLSNIKTTNGASMVASLEQNSATQAIDSDALSQALMGKTVVKDEKNNRILGLTDQGIIEFNDKIIKGVSLTAKNILLKLKEKLENGTARYQSISEALTRIEFTNAAFIETLEFQQVKQELNELLSSMMNGSLEEMEMAREGILSFFDASKNNIVRGRKKFKSTGYSIENSKEKEFLRAIFIGEMYGAGVFNYKFLEMSGEIDQMDFDTIDNIYRKSELFNLEEVTKSLITAGIFQSREEILEHYCENDRKYFVNLATIEEIADYIIKGKITARDAIKRIRIDTIKELSPELLENFLSVPNFPKGIELINYAQKGSKTERFLNKKLLNKLDRERFLKIVLSSKVAESYGNPYTSMDYINEYGKLNSSDMIVLAEAGKIEDEELIKLTAFKSMQVQDPNEYEKMINNLLGFYDLDRLESLLENKKINKKFVELYNDLISNMASKEQKDIYFGRINRILQDKENSDELVTALSICGLNIGENIEYEISEEYITENYLNEKLREEDLIKLYEEGLLSLETVRILFSDTEIITKYRSGIMDFEVLNLLENRTEIIKQEFQNNKLTAQQLFALYSKMNGIEIEEFIEISDGYEFNEDGLVDSISDEITTEKVQALFNNYYISQDDLSVLVGRNIITKEQANEFANQMSTHEQYESIFSLDDRYIVLTSETQGEKGKNNGNGGNGGDGKASKRAGKIKIDPKLQESLLSRIGFDERVLTLQGTNNSLDGYRIYPSEEYGVMVFLKNDKPKNATYIMSIQQGLYFLNKIVREKRNKTGETEFDIGLESDATKKELRETEHVKVRNASAGWGANIVDAIEELSTKFEEKTKAQNEYKKAIDDVIDKIRHDYRERREL
ncbi:MAG: hypothetical protein IKL55_00160 [Clostridia bacterium]|nr:hypothetical protein [Clostridia bacterium]